MVRDRMKSWNKYISIKDMFKFLGLLLCFVFIEVVVRLQPELRVQYMSLFDEVPVMFDAFYSFVLVIIIAWVSNKKAKRVIYTVTYSFFCIFLIAEYFYCRIFDRVFGINTLRYAGEAKTYGGIILSYLDKNTLLISVVFVAVGILGWHILPNFPLRLTKIKESIFAGFAVVVSVAGIIFVPSLFMDVPEFEGNTVYLHAYKKYVYEEWFDNKRAVGMFGFYEFLARDIYLYLHSSEISEEDINLVENYFDNNLNKENDMTGLFEGKNLVLVLMESLDDWLINKETTPTIYKMMEEGINFPNMYTPIYGGGATLNSEFCSYTGLYAPSDGTPLVNYSQNLYSYSLPYLFRNEGYTSKAFHYNDPAYYNRQSIHNAVGFQKYVSYMDYEEKEVAQRDVVLTRNDDVYLELTETTPFFAYVITYTAHGEVGSKPYSHESPELQVYPEYMDMYESEEMDSISAKARVTDDMFKELLKRLEEDGLLEDTVIVGFGDHYDYMINNQEYLKEVSNADNVYELSKTPFFIWADNIESQSIEKVVNTSDIYPTLCNLFGLDNSKYYLGNDVFDKEYEGYALWPDGSWISGLGSFYSSTGAYEGFVDNSYVQEMQKLINEKTRINKIIFDSNYFGKMKNKR